MKYKGMTVNERLYASGLMAKFDAAVEQRDIIQIKLILEKVELNEESIIPILVKLGLISSSSETIENNK